MVVTAVANPLVGDMRECAQVNNIVNSEILWLSLWVKLIIGPMVLMVFVSIGDLGVRDVARLRWLSM